MSQPEFSPYADGASLPLCARQQVFHSFALVHAQTTRGTQDGEKQVDRPAPAMRIRDREKAPMCVSKETHNQPGHP